jgi:hypothetical protein
MESESIAMIVGGIYVALGAGLSEEGIAAANDVLLHLAARPMATLEESRIFKLIAESATLPEEPEQPRPQLRLIQGGGNRAGVGWNPAA